MMSLAVKNLCFGPFSDTFPTITGIIWIKEDKTFYSMLIKTSNLFEKPKFSITTQFMVNMHHTTKCHYPHFYAQRNGGEEK